MVPIVQSDNSPEAGRAARRDVFEWPTWLLIFLVYISWLVLLINYHTIGPALAAPMLMLTLTWHSSMCHEILHGHPARISWLNDLFAWLPISLMVPYFTFKETHLKHHRNDEITLPGIDPESFFVCPNKWQELGLISRALASANMTFSGRMVLGPAIALFRLIGQIGGDIRDLNGSRIALYFIHFCLAGGIVYLATRIFQIPVWQYLSIAYLSQSVLLVRSYFEHRPHPVVSERTVIMESCLPFQLLFLNNNFHAAHHGNPGMPWYKLKQEYHRNREHYLEANGHFNYRGYLDWVKFMFKPVAPPVHPFSHK